VIVWATAALATAALLAAIVSTRSWSSRDSAQRWTPTTTWSATAGYLAGGTAVIDIDALLTSLEQEPYYGRP
jgi:hypothetical protein